MQLIGCKYTHATIMLLFFERKLTIISTSPELHGDRAGFSALVKRSKETTSLGQTMPQKNNPCNYHNRRRSRPQNSVQFE